MSLTKGWAERIAAAELRVQECPKARVMLPLAPEFYSAQTTFVDSANAVQRMVEFAQQRPISHVGISFAFEYGRPGVAVGNDGVAFDPKSIKPSLMALAMTDFDQGKATVYRFVIDLRDKGLVPLLAPILRMPVAFVGHELKIAQFCLLKLKLPEPSIIWDTRTAQVAQNLGRNHPNYKTSKHADIAERIHALRDLEEQEEAKLTLRAICQRHGVTYVQQTPWRDTTAPSTYPSILPEFTAYLIRDLAEDAAAAAALYPHQVLEATLHGTLHHLEKVEMPWVRTNARIEWHGVKTNAQLVQEVSAACEKHLAYLEPLLNAFGIDNVRSQDDLIKFFQKIGLLEHFKQDGKYNFQRKRLRLVIDRHEAIPVIYAARQILDIQNTGLLNLRLVGADGRIHPYSKQLGTDTGRQVARWPNILGVSRLMRPLVIPEAGFGVGEIDLSQIEVFIVAAEYNDEILIQLCNAGDVYVGMVKKFHRDIPESDMQLSDAEFKKKHGEKRDRMKILTLGIIYGSTAYSIALLLKITQSEAEKILAEFMAMFPALQRRRLEIAAFGGIRGHVSTVTGLRRYRGATGPASNWERNWMTNHPIQGSAAVVFKIAGNRLDRLLQEFGAKLIIAFHDAYVFEAPLEHMETVAELIRVEMIRAVQELYPMLRPRADINIKRPECWNKDGNADSIKQWLATQIAPANTLRTTEAIPLNSAVPAQKSDFKCELEGMGI